MHMHEYGARECFRGVHSHFDGIQLKSGILEIDESKTAV